MGKKQKVTTVVVDLEDQDDDGGSKSKSFANGGSPRAVPPLPCGFSSAAMGKMLVAGIIGLMGDGLVQHLEQPAGHTLTVANFDWPRTARIAAYRIPQAPVLDFMWAWFDDIASRAGLTGAKSVAFRILLDQFILLPTFTIIFFVSQGLLEGLDLAACFARTAEGFLPMVIRGSPFWGCTHIVTFGVMRPRYRVAWVSTAAVVWTAYMSYANAHLQVAR